MSYLGHALVENRHGLIIDGIVTPATGTAERKTAVEMVAAVAGGSDGFTTGGWINRISIPALNPS